MRRRDGVPASCWPRWSRGACNVNVDKGSDLGGGADDPGDCTVVDMAVSPEKIDLLTQLAKDFNTATRPRTASVRLRPACRQDVLGRAATLLADGWPTRRATGPAR